MCSRLSNKEKHTFNGDMKMKNKNSLKAYRDADGKIKKIFDRNGVLLAYVFGSVAQEKTGPLSDIDFAVYFEESLSKSEREDLYLDILNDLIEPLGDDIDLVSMNKANLLLNFNIIKSGEILFQKNETVKVQIEAEIMRKNLDMKHYRKRHTETKIKKIANKGLG